jgi:hypothetical protein
MADVLQQLSVSIIELVGALVAVLANLACPVVVPLYVSQRATCILKSPPL